MNKKMANEEQKVLCYMKALFSYDPKVKDDTTHIIILGIQNS